MGGNSAEKTDEGFVSVQLATQNPKDGGQEIPFASFAAKIPRKKDTTLTYGATGSDFPLLQMRFP